MTGSSVGEDPRRTSSPGIDYQVLLDNDSRPGNVAPALRECRWEFLGDADIPVARYISRAFHEREKELLWSRVWQMACRDEDIPEVGDTLVYDICDQSVLLVRVAADQIKAYVNACLHRGRQLRDVGGPAEELRCPFHGFCWNLDGSLKQIPSAWDFPHVDRSSPDCALPEVRVGHWGGFVFVNLDPDCEPFEQYLGVLSEQFEKWPLDSTHRYKSVHVARIFRTNWKVVQEAFMEAYHVVATHPQLLPRTGDANSQYDWWGNVSRAITPNGTPSPHLSTAPSEQEIFDAMSDRRLDEPSLVEVPDGMSARALAGEGGRRRWSPVVGDERAAALSDAELCDSIYYTLFPNFHPWGAYNRIVYRFRPYRDEHEMAVMECMYLEPYDPAGPKPPAAPVHWLGPDDDWMEAPELGQLARVFNQDSFNLPKVQAGLHTMRKPGVTLANYQETKIRHFHHLLSQWVGD